MATAHGTSSNDLNIHTKPYSSNRYRYRIASTFQIIKFQFWLHIAEFPDFETCAIIFMFQLVIYLMKFGFVHDMQLHWEMSHSLSHTQTHISLHRLLKWAWEFRWSVHLYLCPFLSRYIFDRSRTNAPMPTGCGDVQRSNYLHWKSLSCQIKREIINQKASHFVEGCFFICESLFECLLINSCYIRHTFAQIWCFWTVAAKQN